ncbi:MAG: DALR domain-containing protein, partial [Pseudomonadota bacterium]
RLYGALRELSDDEPSAAEESLGAFHKALDDDLNTPAALAELFGLAKAAHKATAADERSKIKAAILEAGATLGLLGANPDSWFAGANDNEADAAEIERLVSERETARSVRDFAEADRLREILTKMGVQLDDSPGGTAWRRIA